MRKKIPFVLLTIQNLYQQFLNKLSKKAWLSIGLYSSGVFIWLAATNANLYQTSDTMTWIASSQWLRDCFLHIGSEACGKIRQWPIWNNLIAYMFSQFATDQIKLWYYLNIICFIVYLFVISFTTRKFSPKWRFLIIYSILLSPLLFQVHSTVTEIQQGLFLTLASLSLIKRQTITCSLLIPLSISMKETFILVWVIILFLSLIKILINPLRNTYEQTHPQVPTGKSKNIYSVSIRNIIKLIQNNIQIRILVIGILIGSLTSFTFNYIRYQQFKNTDYFAWNTLFSMGLNYAVLNFKWSILSPNGGIIFAYGLFLSIIFFYLIFHCNIKTAVLLNLSNRYAINSLERDVKFYKIPCQELIVWIITLLASGLFTTSIWWAAFGWDTWGHRLIVPYIMPMIPLIILGAQQHIEYCENRKNKENQTLPYMHGQPTKYYFMTLFKQFIILITIILAVCGLSYNVVTIQAIYRKDRNVFMESLHSQPSCQKMTSDSRGITPYYWKCAIERFQYVPILHHPPRIIGFEGGRLISIALISLFITNILTPLWTSGNRAMAHRPRIGSTW